jgi:hypothetical protein
MNLMRPTHYGANRERGHAAGVYCLNFSWV